MATFLKRIPARPFSANGVRRGGVRSDRDYAISIPRADLRADL